MKGIKAYGIDLITRVNFERLITKEFTDTVAALPGFLGFAPYGGGAVCTFYNSPSTAALFDTASNRNKAYGVLSGMMECAVILETGHIPVMVARR